MIGIGVGINRRRFGDGIFLDYAARVAADGGTTEARQCVDAVSTLLKSASLLLVPSGYKSGKVYSQILTNGNGDLTFTRASTATRVNSLGQIQVVASGVPRLDYSQDSCPALLSEPQRTNLLSFSEQFDVSGWGKSRTTVTANTTTSPDGTLTADTLSVGVDATSNRHRLFQNLTGSIGTTYTGTYYLKANEHRWMQIVGVVGFSVGVFANFDLLNGTIGNTGVDATASIENVGNGWYRCRVSGVATETSISGFEILTTNNINSVRYPSYQSLVAQDVCYIWGAQFEVGSFASSYIPTTTAAATRLVDAFNRNNIFTNGLITSSGGTWFVELRNNVAYIRDVGSSGLYISTALGSGAGANSFEIRNPATTLGRLQIFKRVAGTGTMLSLTTTNTVKIAIKWNGTSADVFANGVKVVSATAFTETNMQFLADDTRDVPRFIQQMALYPTPLSDNECILLTTL